MGGRHTPTQFFLNYPRVIFNLSMMKECKHGEVENDPGVVQENLVALALLVAVLRYHGR